MQRMAWAKEVAQKVIDKFEGTDVTWLPSDGSYLFNFRVGEGFSYADLLCFCQFLALHRGVAAVPYPTGLVRFAIGGFLSDTAESKQVFKYELEDGFTIFLKYWTIFAGETPRSGL